MVVAVVVLVTVKWKVSAAGLKYSLSYSNVAAAVVVVEGDKKRNGLAGS